MAGKIIKTCRSSKGVRYSLRRGIGKEVEPGITLRGWVIERNGKAFLFVLQKSKAEQYMAELCGQ